MGIGFVEGFWNGHKDSSTFWGQRRRLKVLIDLYESKAILDYFLHRYSALLALFCISNHLIYTYNEVSAPYHTS